MPFLVLVFIGSLNSLQFLGLEWLCSPFLFSRFISISKCWTLIFPITRPYVNRRICCNNRILGINWNKVKVRCLFANDTQFSLVVCSCLQIFISTFRCFPDILSCSLESKHTNQLCSISHCDSNSLLNEVIND